MHIAFFCPPLTGHVKPLTALARELEARGHRVTFVQLSVEAGESGRHTGVRGTIGEMARQTRLLCRLGPDLLREIGADAIVSDQLEAAGGLVAERLGLPWATAACALPINREPGLPPPYVGWRYDPSNGGRGRNAGGWRVADLLMRPLGQAIEAQAEAWGLRPRRRLEDCFSTRLEIAQAVSAIDFPRDALPVHFHYVGPLRHRTPVTIQLPGRRPLVYCSLGTTSAAGGARLFRAVAGACADLGAALVLTHVGRLSPAEIDSLPGTPLVHDFLPQEEVLRHVDAAVTHAGFNSVLEALAAGVPTVALPLAFDQPAVAARIAWAGVGRVVRPHPALLRRRIREALRAVIEQPHYRAQAQAARAQIEAAGGVVRAADLVEAALG